jgi:hypothetical protein
VTPLDYLDQHGTEEQKKMTEEKLALRQVGDERRERTAAHSARRAGSDLALRAAGHPRRMRLPQRPMPGWLAPDGALHAAGCMPKAAPSLPWGS